MRLAVIGALTVIALVVSLNVSLSVGSLVLILTSKAGFVAAVAVLIAVVLRGARAVAGLPVLQTVVGAILKTVLGSQVASGFGARSILANLAGGITVRVPIALIALLVSCLIGAAVV
jgi:hypothetical protein